MKLRHISLLTAAAAIAVAACSSTESAVSSRHTAAGAFTAVQATGTLPVEVRQVPDSAGIVVVTASDRAMQRVELHNTGGTLSISYDNDHGRAEYSKEVKRVVAYCGRELRQLTLTGSGMLLVRHLHTPTELTAVLTGSGMLKLGDTDCLNFTGSLTGSGMMSIKNLQARNVSTSCTGSGMLNVAGVKATAFNCTMSGSGMAKASGEAAKASLALRGSGMLEAAGLHTQSVGISCSGSGMVSYDSSAPAVKVVSGRVSGKGRVTR